jgi:transcriptional regulator GlxA family with amidase domain
MRIAVLALDGVFDTGLAVALDALALANSFAARTMGGAPHFDVSIVGMWKTVPSGQGLIVPVGPVTPDLKPNWVIVPALATGTPEVLVQALARPDVRRAQAQLLKWHAEGAQIAASCIGTFLLAESGLLDGREATTTWWLAPLFRQRYPKVLLDESRMLVPSDRGVTGGAAMGHLDLHPLADPQGEPRACYGRVTLPARQHTFPASALHYPQPPCAGRPAHRPFRALGAGKPQARVFLG